MTIKDNKKYETFINQCVDFCKKSGLNTQKSIYEWLNNDLQKDYKDKAPKWKIEAIAEDITESICLKMRIRK